MVKRGKRAGEKSKDAEIQEVNRSMPVLKDPKGNVVHKISMHKYLNGTGPPLEEGVEGILSTIPQRSEGQQELEDDEPQTKKRKDGQDFLDKQQTQKSMSPLKSVKAPAVMMVPWMGREEWDKVRDGLHQNNDAFVVEELTVWQGRARSLPMGAEVTLYVILANRCDKRRLEKNQDYNEVEGRALYNMAINRFINHIGYSAATVMGETTSAPMQTLSSSANRSVPTWLISLRNDLNHGTSVVAIETLSVAGSYMLMWLKEFYWIVPSKDENAKDTDNFETEELQSAQAELTELISLYLASKVYSDRQVDKIPLRPEIQKHMPPQVPQFHHKKRKQEIYVEVVKLCANLESKILALVKEQAAGDFGVICSTFAEAMCQTEFFSSLNTLYNDPFIYLVKYWNPIIKALLKKKMLDYNNAGLLFYLCTIHTSTESDTARQELSAQWIHKIMVLLEVNGKCMIDDIKLILKQVMMSPNLSSQHFLPDFLKLLEPKAGSKTTDNLKSLSSIWLGDEDQPVAQNEADSLNVNSYFVLNNNVSPTQKSLVNSYEKVSSVISAPVLSKRPDSEEFWKRKSLGEIFTNVDE